MKDFWNRNYKTILIVIAVISFLLALLALYEISLGKFAEYGPMTMWFGLLYGAFCWGDLFVFSILWTIISLILLRIKNSRYFWIALFSFWLIRSLGETNYWFLQQFHPETIPWPQMFERVWIFKNLTDPQFWVFYQIRQQSAAVLSLFGLIYQAVRLIKES